MDGQGRLGAALGLPLSGAQKHGGLFLPVSHVEIHHGGQDLYPNSHQPPNDYRGTKVLTGISEMSTQEAVKSASWRVSTSVGEGRPDTRVSSARPYSAST
jgi:hypothetical protein